MKKRQTYDQGILKILIERYDFKPNYIRKSISGDRVGTIPIRIAEEYKKMLSAKKIAEKKALEQLDQ